MGMATGVLQVLCLPQVSLVHDLFAKQASMGIGNGRREVSQAPSVPRWAPLPGAHTACMRGWTLQTWLRG